jgi:pimeloyl-ACP methyl ester carboxylesterase
MLATALAILLAAAPTPPAKLPLHACTVRGVAARCATLQVPENRDTGLERTIGLRVVVLPSLRKPARPDAFTYLAGGPGGAAASEMPAAALALWSRIHERHDIVLVDQRGTGGSHPLECPEPDAAAETEDALRGYLDACVRSLDGDATQYGSAAAADDLEAVRVALGYRKLNVYGTSYGATLAQVYLARHSAAVRSVVLDGGTLVDIPFFERFAANGQRALDQVAARCATVPACARAFPRWPAQLRSLIAAWNAKPVRVSSTQTLDGDGLAGVVQSMTLMAESASSIPLVVARAAAGRHGPLARFLDDSETTRSIMYWSIWCNESWVGLGATGPWNTYLDGNTAAALSVYGSVCKYFPKHEETEATRTRVRSDVPLLALVGGADPQDPIGNLAGLGAALPNSRAIVVPGLGHAIGQYGCLPSLVAQFVDRANARRLDARCTRTIKPTPFVLG